MMGQGGISLFLSDFFAITDKQEETDLFIRNTDNSNHLICG